MRKTLSLLLMFLFTLGREGIDAMASQVPGAFRLVASLEDDQKPLACEEPRLRGAIRAERWANEHR